MMSVLADIYVSPDNQDAVRYDSAPDSFADREQYTSFTVLELSTLWAATREIAWYVDLLDEFPSVLSEEGGEQSIHRLPDAMTSQLLKFTPQQVSIAAPRWAATDEMACKPADVQPIIEGLVRLALRASETRGNLYFWNCV
jgi:hypothetical protein